MVLKKYNDEHSGYDRYGVYTKGHRLKQHISQTIAPVIETIKEVKRAKPVAHDVVKASRSLHGRQPTIKQGNKVLENAREREKVEAKRSYQFLIPYLTQFQQNNPGTVIDYHRDKNLSITKFFVCPGIMNNKLRYVRPVLSLDAAHLSSDVKGTLYLATVLSGNNEILPIAFGMTEDNENKEGWLFFLRNLKKACPMLLEHHNLPRCHPFKLYTFISDRDKGINPALEMECPLNQHSHCQFHIRQNVVQQFGVKAGDKFRDIGMCYSISKEEKLFEELRKINKNAETYILKMNPERWRNTQWWKNNSLPPRYGILTSNSSESCNSMFKDARTCGWLASLDKMLHITQVKIASLRDAYKDKTGMITCYKDDYKEKFNKSAVYNVLRISEELNTYKVYIGTGEDYDHSKSHILNMTNETCTCGIWQDTSLMCKHVMAYYRVVEKKL